jgi:GNAT superfamily N-acetyltransferase
MSHYSDYIKEREGYECIENDRGFITFVVSANICYIRDIYVVRSDRGMGVAKGLLSQVTDLAKSRGVNVLGATVCTTTNGVENSMSGLLYQGFKYSHAEGNLLFFKKEI